MAGNVNDKMTETKLSKGGKHSNDKQLRGREAKLIKQIS